MQYADPNKFVFALNVSVYVSSSNKHTKNHCLDMEEQGGNEMENNQN